MSASEPGDSLARRRAHPLVFVNDLTRPELDPADYHHLRRALRLRPGAEIVVADGTGAWCPAHFAERPEPMGAIAVEPPPPYPVTVFFTPVKGDRADWVVQKLTELGVDRIVPVHSERSVVRWDAARGARHGEKWTRVAQEACMQSRRVRRPEIGAVADFEAHWDLAVARPDERPPGPAVVLAEPGAPLLPPSARAVFIGPEGGWSDRERAAKPAVGLPGGILRAETAAIVAATLLVFHRQGVGYG